MPVFVYGKTRFEWVFQPEEKLKRHYITVERGQPVLLRGPALPADEREPLIRRKAQWIRDQLVEVNAPVSAQNIVTGSRLKYRGKSYYCFVSPCTEGTKPTVSFNYSSFFIESPSGSLISPQQLEPALEAFYRQKATEKLFPRIQYWEQQTGLQANGARLFRFASRWASCTTNNRLEFNPRCMELAPDVMDYVIVHELCHTVEKDHSKPFWSLVALHYPNWKARHLQLERAALGLVL